MKNSSEELAIWIARLLDKKGAQNVAVLETKPGTYVADYLVVATGTSSRHIQTLLDTPCRELKKLGFPPLAVEGEGSHWMLADLGDVVLHIFDDSARSYFDIDGLWSEVPRVSWQEKRQLKEAQS